MRWDEMGWDGMGWEGKGKEGYLALECVWLAGRRVGVSLLDVWLPTSAIFRGLWAGARGPGFSRHLLSLTGFPRIPCQGTKVSSECKSSNEVQTLSSAPRNA